MVTSVSCFILYCKCSYSDGCQRVIVETDSLTLKQAVTSDAYDFSQLGDDFRDIKFQFRVGFMNVCVQHCPRMCNQAAHALAAHGTIMSIDTCEIWLGQFPSFVSDYVAGDLSSQAI